MSLELNKLTQAVNALSTNALQQLAELEQKLPIAAATLNGIGVADEALHRKVQAAIKFRWTGAIPTAEAVSVTFSRPPLPTRLNVIAADGSQIYPDRHGLALYYLINIGSIVFRHGVDQAPTTASEPEVFYDEADLYEDAGGGQIASVKIDAERDRRELARLAQWAKTEAPTAPTVAFLDNGLLLYLSLQSTNQRLVDEALEKYIAHLEELKVSGAAVAGMIDRPRAASVVRLLSLALLNQEEINDASLRDLRQFARLTDATLFQFLPPHHRSALFENASPQNLDQYKPRGHAIYFFYLNTGKPNKPNLLRVEVPEWVAHDADKLNLVHTAILEQSRTTDGFPYVLMRAHELAVVTQRERQEFDKMIMGALIRRGLTPSLSHKAQGKAWTGATKQRYP